MTRSRAALVAVLVLASAAGPPLAAATPDRQGIAPPRANERPLADAGLDQSVVENATVQLDAAGSRDPDGRIVAYEWAITAPNGSTLRPACPACERTTFRPRRTGTYEVTLTVTDDDGATATDTLYVTVSEYRPPALAVEGPTDVTTGTTYTYTADVTPGTTAPERVVWTVDGTRVATHPVGGTTDTLSWTFSDPGTHTVRATVYDGGVPPRSATDTLTVSATSPPAAAVSANRTTVRPGQDVALTGTGSTDPDGGSIRRYDWTLGDGRERTGPGQVVDYASPGTYTVGLTVTDDEGQSDEATVTVTVEPPATDPPVASLVANRTDVTTGQAVALDAGGSRDPDGGGITSYEWSVDGATGPGTVVRYATPGNYTVGVTVTDDDGETATATETIRVRPADAGGGDPPGDEGCIEAVDATIRNVTPDSPAPDETVDVDATYAGCDVSVAWDLDGATLIATWPTGATVSWSTPGTYEVTYRVTHENGSVATDTATVTVEGSCTEPVGASIAGHAPSDPEPGESVEFDATPEGCDLAVEWTVEGADPTSADDRSATVTWDDPGTYEVTYAVTDGDGDTATDAVTVTVARDGGGGPPGGGVPGEDEDGPPTFVIEGPNPLTYDAPEGATTDPLEASLRPTRPHYELDVTSGGARDLLSVDNVTWTLETAAGETVVRETTDAHWITLDSEPIKRALHGNSDQALWLIATASENGKTKTKRIQIDVCGEGERATVGGDGCKTLENEYPDLEIPTISGPKNINPNNTGIYRPSYDNKRYWNIDGDPVWTVYSKGGDVEHRKFTPSPIVGDFTKIDWEGSDPSTRLDGRLHVEVDATSDTSVDQIKTKEEITITKTKAFTYRPPSDGDDGNPGDGDDPGGCGYGCVAG